MTRSAHLLLSDDSEYPNRTRDEVFIESDSAIPLLWLALFIPDNLVTKANAAGKPMPYLVAPVAQAKLQFSQHEKALRRLIGNLDEYLTDWQQTFSQVTKRYVKADIAEMLTQPADLTTTLPDALAFFDTPTATAPDALLKVTGLRQLYDVKTRMVKATSWERYLILGIGTANWVSWSEKTGDVYDLGMELTEAPPPESKRVQKPWWQFWG